MSGRMPLKSRPILEAVVKALVARRAANSASGAAQRTLARGSMATASASSSSSSFTGAGSKDFADLPGLGLPTWHLARSLSSRGHFLNVGVPVTGLISEHGVCATPAWLDEELKKASKTLPLIAGGHGSGRGGSGGFSANALLASRGEESLCDQVMGHGLAVPLPMDYWTTYNDRMRTFH